MKNLTSIAFAFLSNLICLNIFAYAEVSNESSHQSSHESYSSSYDSLLEAKEYQQLLNNVKQDLIIKPDNARLYFLAAKAHMGLKNYTDSVEMAVQAVRKDPEVSEHYRLLADTEVLKLLGAQNTSVIRLPGLARRTKHNYQRAIHLDPNNIKAREGLGLLYLLAPKIVGGSIKKAKIQADEIAKLDMNKAMPFYIGIQKKNKNWSKALELAEQWEKQEPNLWQPQEDRFRIYFEQKKYEQAAQVLLKYLGKNLNESDATSNAHYLMGLVASDSGLYLSEGRDCLLKYLKSTPSLNQPGHEWSYYRLATIYEKLGEKRLAKETAQKAIKASPQNSKVAALVNEFLIKFT